MIVYVLNKYDWNRDAYTVADIYARKETADEACDDIIKGEQNMNALHRTNPYVTPWAVVE